MFRLDRYGAPSRPMAVLRSIPYYLSTYAGFYREATVLERGFDNEGTFYYLPFSGLDSIVEVFRRRLIGMLMNRGLLKKACGVIGAIHLTRWAQGYHNRVFVRVYGTRGTVEIDFDKGLDSY